MTGARTADAARRSVRDAVASVAAADQLEREQRADVLRWVDSGAPLWRVASPDVPPRHLVSYVVAWDDEAGRLLLVEHVKAGLWLPTGGHVEPGEDPAAAALREAGEELGVDAPFTGWLGPRPLFLSSTRTVGVAGGHVDVSLWYVVDVDSRRSLDWDRGEFTAARWFSLDEVLAADPDRLDPCMHRFTRKLAAARMGAAVEVRGRP